jgi:hypothetical protein
MLVQRKNYPFIGASWKKKQSLLAEESKKFSDYLMDFDYGSSNLEITARNWSGST